MPVLNQTARFKNHGRKSSERAAEPRHEKQTRIVSEKQSLARKRRKSPNQKTAGQIHAEGSIRKIKTYESMNESGEEVTRQGAGHPANSQVGVFQHALFYHNSMQKKRGSAAENRGKGGLMKSAVRILIILALFTGILTFASPNYASPLALNPELRLQRLLFSVNFHPQPRMAYPRKARVDPYANALKIARAIATSA